MSDPPPQALQPKQEPQKLSNGRPLDQPKAPVPAMQKLNLTSSSPSPSSSNKPDKQDKPSRPDPPKSTFKSPQELAKEKEKDKKEKKHHLNIFKKH